MSIRGWGAGAFVALSWLASSAGCSRDISPKAVDNEPERQGGEPERQGGKPVDGPMDGPAATTPVAAPSDEVEQPPPPHGELIARANVGDEKPTEDAVDDVASVARRGCRSPTESGCNPCCRAVAGPSGAPSCTELRWTGGEQSQTKPWYNAATSLDECPDSCARCASCLERDEEALTALNEPAGCNCEEQKVGVDPCYQPGSCACYCSRFQRLSEKCPGADE